MSGTFTAIDGKTNKIAWQHKTPYRIGGGGGATVTAGGLVFRGEPDGNFLAINAKTGEELWRFPNGGGGGAPPAGVGGEQEGGVWCAARPDPIVPPEGVVASFRPPPPPSRSAPPAAT